MDILRMKKILLLALIIGSCFSNTSYAGSLAGEEDGNPSHLSNYCWAFKFANGNVTANADGTCSIADAGGAGSGDNITVNSSAAADANFLNGDIDWTLNGASTPDDITATVACTGCIDATDMAADSVGESELIESMNFVATGGWDHGGGTLEVPNSTSLPGTCTVGQVYMDTDATSGQRIYACESSNTWALQGDGGGAGGGTKTYAVFKPLDNQPPASSYATLDTRNSIAVLDFDTSTEESAIFVGIIPEAASLGSGLIVKIHWTATSATTGDCRWGAQIQRNTTDLDSDSFDTATEGTSTTNGTSGIITVTSLTLTNIDSVAAGDSFRLKIYRDVTDAADTMAGDAELVAVEVRSAA